MATVTTATATAMMVVPMATETMGAVTAVAVLEQISPLHFMALGIWFWPQNGEKTEQKDAMCCR
jgi:hypothetical protein